MSLFASLILSLSLIMGLSPTSSMPALPASVAVDCFEDMPCWDSETMGIQLPALSDDELDAWDALNTSGIVGSPDVAVEYVETLDYLPASFPVGYFAVVSDTQPHTFHVMQWITLHHA